MILQENYSKGYNYCAECKQLSNSNGEQPPCFRTGECHITGGAAFELLDENIDIALAFRQIIFLSPTVQVKVSHRKNEIETRTIPDMSMATDVMDNWYRELSRFERADWMYYFAKMYTVVKSYRLA